MMRSYAGVGSIPTQDPPTIRFDTHQICYTNQDSIRQT